MAFSASRCTAHVARRQSTPTSWCDTTIHETQAHLATDPSTLTQNATCWGPWWEGFLLVEGVL